MRQPTDKEQIICPANGEKLKPEYCWDSRLPGGKTVTYGIIPIGHKHKNKTGYFSQTIEEDCEWAGLPAPQPVEVA